MAKILLVSSAMQAALMNNVLIKEIITGFWSAYRPQGHGDVWKDVVAEVSVDGTLGPQGWEAPRNYNLLNLDFFNASTDGVTNETRLVEAAKTAKPNANSKSVKKELIELGRIVAGRLPSREANFIKLFRGNHQPGTMTVSLRKARQAGKTLADTAATSTQVTKPMAAKKTVKKIRTGSAEVSADTTAALNAATAPSAQTETQE